MPQNRALTPEERNEVLAHVKPQGTFRPVKQRTPFGVQPIAWEEHLDLGEWRNHVGMGRVILPVLANATKTQSVCNSITNRLRKINPSESWVAYAEGKSVLLRFNGPKRSYQERQSHDSGNGENGANGGGLFAATG